VSGALGGRRGCPTQSRPRPGTTPRQDSRQQDADHPQRPHRHDLRPTPQRARSVLEDGRTSPPRASGAASFSITLITLPLDAAIRHNVTFCRTAVAKHGYAWRAEDRDGQPSSHRAGRLSNLSQLVPLAPDAIPPVVPPLFARTVRSSKRTEHTRLGETDLTGRLDRRRHRRSPPGEADAPQPSVGTTGDDANGLSIVDAQRRPPATGEWEAREAFPGGGPVPGEARDPAWRLSSLGTWAIVRPGAGRTHPADPARRCCRWPEHLPRQPRASGLT